MLKFKGAGLFRQRLVLSTISGKAMRIDGVRASSEEPGPHEHLACRVGARVLRLPCQDCVNSRQTS